MYKHHLKTEKREKEKDAGSYISNTIKMNTERKGVKQKLHLVLEVVNRR